MGNLPFTVRPAAPADVKSLFDLIMHLAVYEKAPHEVVNTPEDLLRDGFLTDPPLYRAWVSELADGTVTGMALCYTRYSTWKGPVLYLEDIVVNETYRGNGMGLALFEACLAHAREQGYRRMTWQVLDWNQPAIDFYHKWGAKFDAEWLNASIDFQSR